MAELAHSTNYPSGSSLQDIDVLLQQKTLLWCIDEMAFQENSAPDARSRALAKSLALSHAGDWLNTTPSRALHILNRDFILCWSYLLGLPVTNRTTTCQCESSNADVLGGHLVGWQQLPYQPTQRPKRHSLRCCSVSHPNTQTFESSHTDNIYIPNWQSSCPESISTLKPLAISGSALSKGHALQVGEDRKKRRLSMRH